MPEMSDSVLAAELIEKILSVMAERRVPEIMAESNRLGQVEVKPQQSADCTADLGDLNRVDRPVGNMLIELGGEIHHLGLADIAPEPA